MARIFITVGTYKRGFNALLEAAEDIQGHAIACQVGYSTYKPKGYEYFDFREDLTDYYKNSDVVVCSGGAGTIFACLSYGKRIVSALDSERFAIYGKEEYLDINRYFESKGYLVTCVLPPDSLVSSIKIALALKEYKYEPPPCTIAEEISEFINNET